MTCKYCDHPDCEAERHPDDARILRMCRHRVMLERDFFRNRLARYEAVKPAPQVAPSGHAMACGCTECVERRGRHEDWLGITPGGVPIMTEPVGAPRQHGSLCGCGQCTGYDLPPCARCGAADHGMPACPQKPELDTSLMTPEGRRTWAAASLAAQGSPLHCHGCMDDMCPGCCDCENK